MTILILPAPENSRSTIPRVLYRRFSTRKDAENFVRLGEVRFRSLSHYQTVEDDARRDAHEGSAYVDDATGITMEVAPLGTSDFGSPIKMTGQFRKSLTHAERFFVSCYSYRRHPDQKKFGRFLVRISRAQPWLNAIGRELPGLFWGRVSYFDPTNLSHLVQADPLWLSKPLALRMEYEFRLLMLVNGHKPGHAERASARVLLGDLSSVADVIEEGA